ncbi:MAG: SDR family NAD(P)-dependent oxidoreductase [Bacteroidales bacterium]|nr:SDR family NAD(P)-dependent oxidoreductase [Bacteroidales bacterium]
MENQDIIFRALFGNPKDASFETGLPHYVLTVSGRIAERLFFQTLRTQKRKVLQNILFETTLHNEVKAKFEPVEIPDQEIFSIDSKQIFRGGIDTRAFELFLERQSGEVGMILVELCNNASGGYPVSMAQIKEISRLGKQYEIPFVMDGSRILRNAELIRQYEKDYRDKDLFSILDEIMSCADYVFGSLSKDFGLNLGGFIAAKDKERIVAIKNLGKIEGGLTSAHDSNLILKALQDRNYLESKIRNQLRLTKQIHEELAFRNVPVMQPGVGHCILVRVNEIEGFKNRKYPRESFLRMLYERWGIRGGIHSVGNQQQTVLNQCIRLAIPIGLNDAQNEKQIITHICQALDVSSSNASFQSMPKSDSFEKRGKAISSPTKGNTSQGEVSSCDVAIIGLSGRYPNAKSVEEFWENLKSGKKCISEIPSERWDWKEFYHANPKEAIDLKKSYGKWGGFIEDYNCFDATFFNIPHAETAYIDPQELLFLEECWRALEDAGYRPSGLSPDISRRAGVFGGISRIGFNLYSVDAESLYYSTSISSMVSRVSYFMDFKGPSIAIDNDCSSSFTAIHEACEYIRSGKGDLALAGGVNLYLHPSIYLYLSRIGMLSQDSNSAAFCKGGKGFIPGEGVGVVVLKNYSQAIQNGDSIYAIIRGSAINQNGRMSKFGRPNQKQQQAVIKEALSQSGFDPRTISYIEAAAYGSDIGDTIEIAALTDVFGKQNEIQGNRRIGSVKPNIGHCEAAAGMSQLTKVLLSMKYKTLAPTLMFGGLNPNIDFEQIPFKLQTKVSPWEPISVDGQLIPRRAGISTFGGSGVNAHIIIEEHVPEKKVKNLSPSIDVSNIKSDCYNRLFVLSAQSKTRLKDYVSKWVDYLEKNSHSLMDSISYTLQTGREEMDFRLAVVFTNKDELINLLKKWNYEQNADAHPADFVNSNSIFYGELEKRKEKKYHKQTEINSAVNVKNWAQLGELWVQGNFIPWVELYRPEDVKEKFLRMNGLPTYPFKQDENTVDKSSSSLNKFEVNYQENQIHQDEDNDLSGSSSSLLREKILFKLASLFGEVLNIPVSQIDLDEHFENYGIDSSKILQFNQKFSRVFGEISKTLFFEYSTLNGLSEFFIKNNLDACAKWVEFYNETQPVHSNTTEIKSNKDFPPSRSISSKEGKSSYWLKGRSSGQFCEKKISDSIAIIGISGRYPQAANLDEFWENLKSGRDSIEEIPISRWSLKDFYHPNKEDAVSQGKSYCKWGGFLKGFSEFDPLFFNISPREAMNMDPHERLFLQSCWETLEDAGYTRERLSTSLENGGETKTGVFVGITRAEFGIFGPELWKEKKKIYPYTLFGSVANRVSYVLNIHGPSMPIDTMCSSSLTAIHEACEYLRHNPNEMALAGGVNLLLHPYTYVGLCASQFLSVDGKCRSFGKGGTGYVPGEGVGTILLKNLSRAIEDRDNIYAVIRSTGINHGGKTNGYTVPNPKLQGKLIQETLEKAGIDACSISYIEAHGTGTELGDPIEIRGLTQAFNKNTLETGFCAIGSVKSNVGHLEAAAGIAGLTKVILQMKNKKLVPSLHADELNPNIDFTQTPFFINQELREWKSPIVNGKTCSRIAGVSSFGAGGSNAHIIVEEYIPESNDISKINLSNSFPAIIVLSAKSENRLKVYAEKLLHWIEQKEINLADLGYTLQVGREAMENRLGLIVHSTNELVEKLHRYIQGDKEIEGVFTGQVSKTHKQDKDLLSLFDVNEDFSTIITNWIDKGKWNKLLGIWVNGLDFNWNKIYGEVKPQRISAPAYPFVCENYWFENVPIPVSAEVDRCDQRLDAQIHPLLHRNTSDLSVQRFSSLFSGNEFFLNDHQVKGQKILPGMAYLEMVRAAVEQAIPANLKSNGNLKVELHSVVWIQPFVLNENKIDGKVDYASKKVISISLIANEHDSIDFEIYSGQYGDQRDDQAERVVHCQGQAVFMYESESDQFTFVPAKLNIEELKSQIESREEHKRIEAEDIYPLFARMGLQYGTAFQGIVKIYKGENQLLAQLCLPEILDSSNEYVLHPSMLDSSLQTSITFFTDTQRDVNQSFNQTPLPFALESIRVISACTKEMFAWVRFSPSNKTVSNSEHSVIKMDVDLCDMIGNVCVEIRGFSLRIMKEELNSVNKKSPFVSCQEEINTGLNFLVPVWSSVYPTKDVETREALLNSAKILLLGSEQSLLTWVKKSYPNSSLLQLSENPTIEEIQLGLKNSSFDQLLWIAPDVIETDNSNKDSFRIIDHQEQGVLTVFRIIKALLSEGFAYKDLQWTIITRMTQKVKKDDRIQPAHASVFGLIGSLAKEYPHWNLRLLDLDSLEHIQIEECLSLNWDKYGNGLALRQSEWFSHGLAYASTLTHEIPLYKTNGVYVVVGGAGGLGEVWSRFMIEQYQAQIIWIGRKNEDSPEIVAKIKSFSQFTPLYFSADATDYGAMEQVAKKILEKYPTVNGIVHSAIILQDQSIMAMEESKFRAGLSAKVDISINMDKVFGSQNLDFMLFFSSLQSFYKAPGQSNYAAGCTFKDSFAQYIQQQHSYPIKIVNWGYWGSVGIVADESYKKRIAQIGIGSIEPNEGMLSLQSFMNSNLTQLAFIKSLNVRAISDLGVLEGVAFYPKDETTFLEIQGFGNLQNSEEQALILKASLPPFDMEIAATEILISSLKLLGFFISNKPVQEPIGSKIFKLSDLLQKKLPTPFYEQWLKYNVDYLQQHGWLNADLTLNREVKDLEKLWDEWDTKKIGWAVNPNLSSQITLLEACLKALPDILNGKRPATEVMFPNSSMHLVEGIYKGNALADFSNERLGDVFSTILRQQLKSNKEKKIRVLEIGAGTGGTTVKLLPRLQEFGDAIVEYCYTDLSKAFLMHAEQNFQPQYQNLRTAIFDVSKPLLPQSISAGNYDLVIAANVLHATPYLRDTLRNAKALLKNHGVLLINEISTWSLFTHLTFGLLEGWWLYKDIVLRMPGSPALTPENWQRILAEEGFTSIFFPAQEAHSFGHQVIAASSNGFVRQMFNKQVKAAVKEKISTQVIASPKPEIKIKAISSETLFEKSVLYFQKLAAETLGMGPEQLSPNQPLTEYGLDSILVVQLTNQLRKVFPDITSTLFFEIPTINGLVDYFLENNLETLKGIISIDVPEQRLSEKVLTSKDEKVISKNWSNRIPSRISPQPIRTTPTSSYNLSVFDVAIIGLSGRYPQSKNLNEFWDNLVKGINCISEVPKDRWNWEDYYDAEKGKSGKIYTRWGGFIEDIDKFDPLFFSISPKEAERMDPQERLFLETCYHAIEDAGYTPESLGDISKIGVFVGVMNSRYGQQPAFYSIANRVSYCLNFQGPSMAIDSACSSSLTAIHTALESMYCGLSECAIVGGVNLIIDPIHFSGLTEMTMLSEGNQCKAFGEKADGFIDAEGVGVFVLKPLSKAEKDGDHIYGIIKGSAVNAGGKTNGYTVPNPRVQSAVVSKALERARISAEQLSYIEAHGTGTALGDPIEVAGLTRAFKENCDNANIEKQFCALGSVKSNIGHCESAAGAAGLTKVLLQMKYKQLVPSLHSEVSNPEINFSQTPFKVQKNLEKWHRLSRIIDGMKEEIPRTAGVSSFGAGGANAHIIVQEYISPFTLSEAKGLVVSDDLNEQIDVIIPLSARTKEQLQQKVKDLLAFLHHTCFVEKQNFEKEEQENIPCYFRKPHLFLRNIAYTLQVGRESMEERLGLLVNSVDQLTEKLEAYINDKHQEYTYQGHGKNDKNVLALFDKDEDLKETVNKWIIEKKYSRILDLWVAGLELDWNKLYEKTDIDLKPQRISLPGYPFARERYWIELDREKMTLGSIATYSSLSSPTGAIGCDLQLRNTSTFSVQRFSTMLTGREFFLTDHVINGNKTLPGVVYLEMARKAVETSTNDLHDENRMMRFKNISWIQPLISDIEPIDVQITLSPNDKGDIIYDIFRQIVDNEQVVHSQGVIQFIKRGEIPSLDLATIKEQCSQQKVMPVQYYKMFSSMGINYGSSHKGIDAVYIGMNQVLASLSIPTSVSSTLDQYVLHPSMLDSALQTSLGLFAGLSEFLAKEQHNMDGSLGIIENLQAKPMLPFALESMEVYNRCTPKMWAHIKYAMGSNSDDAVIKLDIDIADEEGSVCICMRGFTARSQDNNYDSLNSPVSDGVLLMEPYWREIDVQEKTSFVYEQHLLILIKDDNVLSGLQEMIEKTMKGVRCLSFKIDDTSIDKYYEECCIKIFTEIRNILISKFKGKAFIQIIVAENEASLLLSGLSGILKTAQKENPLIVGQVIEIGFGKTTEEIIEILRESISIPHSARIRYSNDDVKRRRFVQDVREINIPEKEIRFPWKENGIYLITGGAGGLGLLFAQEIVEKIKKATIVLVGRSELSSEKDSKLKDLENAGARIVYKRVDISSKKEVDDLIKSIQTDIGNLNGIIHAAGIIHDNFIIKKTVEEFKDVLLPKVSGLVNLDETTKLIQLDLFVLFSSLSGFAGNVGQSDYAAANAFMDAYAEYRNNLVLDNKRWGKTLSINWPLWKDGGMNMSLEDENLMKQSSGMTSLQTANGIDALYKSLDSGAGQVLVAEGDVRQIKLLFEDSSPKIIKNSFNSVSEKEDILFCVREIISHEIKLDSEKIKPETPFVKYGIDSLMQMSIIKKLEKIAGELPKTLLYEYSNMHELVRYLEENHTDEIQEWFSEKNTSIVNNNNESSKKKKLPLLDSLPLRTNSKHRFGVSKTMDLTLAKHDSDPIAIIGMSGRYPLSDTLEELWEHLKAGHNCITQADTSRWNNSLLRSLSKNEFYSSEKKYYGGFLKNINKFDHQLFEVAEDRVLELTPETRMFLEIVWETFEDAGYSKDRLNELQDRYQKGVGVFVGTMYNQYSWNIPSSEKAILSTNGTEWNTANRTSHFFNLTGPSMAVNSACSSSMIALHLACESLQQQTCSMALAGGVNLTLDPSKYAALEQAHFLGKEDRSMSFGIGDGYIPGEGVGTVLLKPLSKAIEDCDRIYAVIKGSFINHSGGRQMFTAPDPKQQADLITNAIDRSGIDIETIGYVESAANGSPLGDLIEVNALKNAFARYTGKKQFCALGSVKSNLGHLEAASGISQLCKVLLQLKYKTLVPTINAQPQNPNIKLEGSAFYLQKTITPWDSNTFKDDKDAKNLPRRSMINSFGAGGAYASVIIEEPIEQNFFRRKSGDLYGETLILFSAKTKWSLIRYLDKIKDFLQSNLEKNIETDIYDLALSLFKINHNLEFRAAFVVSSIDELLQKLDELIKTQMSHPIEGGFFSSLSNVKLTENSTDPTAIQQSLLNKDYKQIAQYWIEGETIDFRSIYEYTGTQWLDLPKYAFDHFKNFDFQSIKSSTDNSRTTEFDEESYRNILEKLSKGELSKNEVFEHFEILDSKR